MDGPPEDAPSDVGSDRPDAGPDDTASQDVADSSTGDSTVSPDASEGGPGPVVGNRPPVFLPGSIGAAREGQRFAHALQAEDPDADPLVFSLREAPTGMTVDGATGRLDWLPRSGTTGRFIVAARVTDPAGAFAEQRLEVAVEEGVEAPRITSLPTLTATAGAAWTYAATAEDPDDAALTWVVTGPAGMTVDPLGRVTWAVPSGAMGVVPVTLTVRDVGGHEDRQAFTLGVTDPSDRTPPTVSLTAPAADAVLTAPAEVQGTVTDASLAGYTLSLCPQWGGATDCIEVTRGLSAVTAGRLGTVDPRSYAAGTYTLRLTARDASGNTAEASVAVRLAALAEVGAVRLRFLDLTLRAGGAELALERIYDGLDLRRGELGYGWRYEWSMGHSEQPQRPGRGWVVRMVGRIPPTFAVEATDPHPLRFALPDGRSYRFQLTMELESGLSTIRPVRPVFVEEGSTGATLRALNAWMTPYSSTDYTLFARGDRIYEDVTSEDEFTPAYYELTTDWGEAFTFEASTGAVKRLRDPSGLTVDLTSGTSVRVGARDVARFERDAAGQVTSVTDTVTGRVVRYRRDAAGDLVGATLAEGTEHTYTYASGHRLTGYSAPGEPPERWEYDARGRLTRHTGEGGAVLEHRYDDARGRVTTIDVLGRSVTQELDAQGRVTRLTDALGNSTSFTYVGASTLEASRTDAMGRTTTFTYDRRGRQTVVRDALGQEQRTEYDDLTSQPLRVTDGAGRVFSQALDSSGRLVSQVLPDGTTARRYSYPDANTIVSEDALGRRTTTRYDDRARVVSATDALGRATTTTYDDTAHTLTVATPDGERVTAAQDPLERTTRLQLREGALTYAYEGSNELPTRVTGPGMGALELRRDRAGQLTEVVANGRVVEQLRYDAAGQLVSHRGPEGGTTYRYDAAGRLSHVTAPSGEVDIARDPVGRIVELRSGAGEAQHFAWDAAGHLVAADAGPGTRLELTRDRSGRTTRILDALGRSTDITYDANGRRTGFTYPGGLTFQRSYQTTDLDDEHAPVARETDLEGITRSFTYDSEDRLASVAEMGGGTTTYTYTDGVLTLVRDALGRQTRRRETAEGLEEVISPEGRAQRWQYDDGGRVTRWTRGDGSEITYEYADGVVRARTPSGATLELARDEALGTVITRGTAAGVVRELVDDSGRTRYVELDDGASVLVARTLQGEVAAVTALTPGGGRLVTRYTYDARGRVTALTAPSGGSFRYTYDAGGRLTREDRPNGTSTVWTFGALDRPTAVRHLRGEVMLAEYRYTYDARGRVATEADPEGRYEYGYDALSRLVSVRRFDGERLVETVTRAYDAVGNLLTLTDGAGMRRYTYDTDDRLLEALGPAGTVTYGYNARGALVSVTAPEGVTRYDYDDLDRLTAVTLPTGAVVRYQYDVGGRLLARTEGAVTRRCLPLPLTPRGYHDCAATYTVGAAPDVEVLTHGPLGLAQVTRGGAARYVLGDANGSPIALTDAAGAVSGAVRFDPHGARRGAPPAGFEYGYRSERQDPTTGLVYLRARWYDPRTGRFLTPDREGAASRDPRSLHRYLYGLGDPVNRADPSGGWSLSSVMSAVSIQGILSTIARGAASACIGRRVVFQIGVAFARWAIERAVAPLFDEVLTALRALSRITEYDFHRELHDIICNGFSGLGVGGFEFFVPIDRCGFRVNGRSGQSTTCGSAFPGPAAYRGLQGVDILYAGTVPVELKVGSSSFDEDQLKTYCRFAARQGSRAVVYGYVTTPMDRTNLRRALSCWRCWRGAGASCTQRPTGGSVYLAFGVRRGRGASRRIYVPNFGCADLLR